jgi:hypothetical protein
MLTVTHSQPISEDGVNTDYDITGSGVVWLGRQVPASRQMLLLLSHWRKNESRNRALFFESRYDERGKKNKKQKTKKNRWLSRFDLQTF